jgi:ABC-type sugar transport system substrate-binding protein
MADIFISYKREDWPEVKPLVHALETKKLDVWWDEKLLPGEKIGPAIQKILDGVSCVIVVWSKRSMESNWVPDEATYGRDHDMLIPISIDGCKPPLGFQQILTADLQSWRGDSNNPNFRKVLLAVRKFLRRPKHRWPDSVMAGKPGPQTQTANIKTIRDQFTAAHNKRVFLIVGSFTEEWQIALNYHLLRATQQYGLSCSVLVPSEDHSVDEQRAMLKSALADGNNYFGGILICSGWPDRVVKEIRAIVKGLSFPLILVDRNPPVGLARIPAKLSYVSISDSAGGKLAAEAVLELSRHSPIKRILAIAGFAKQSRQESFQKTISKSLKHCEITTTEDGKFDRWISENIAYNYITDAIEAGSPFDAIFCTADSMTLGCLDAIERVANWKGCARPKIIGYDGTTTTRKLVDSKRSSLVRIVIQDNNAMAETSVALMINANQKAKGGRIDRIVWVKPYLYPR